MKTLYSPESNIGSTTSPFFTWSDSPVSDDSSTLRSLLCISIPSAGSKSPATTKPRKHHTQKITNQQINKNPQQINYQWMAALAY